MLTKDKLLERQYLKELFLPCMKCTVVQCSTTAIQPSVCFRSLNKSQTFMLKFHWPNPQSHISFFVNHGWPNQVIPCLS